LEEVILSLSKKLKVFENSLICLQGITANPCTNRENLCVILNARNILISVDWVMPRKRCFGGGIQFHKKRSVDQNKKSRAL
jgi:hypothetical protein